MKLIHSFKQRPRRNQKDASIRFGVWRGINKNFQAIQLQNSGPEGNKKIL